MFITKENTTTATIINNAVQKEGMTLEKMTDVMMKLGFDWIKMYMSTRDILASSSLDFYIKDANDKETIVSVTWCFKSYKDTSKTFEAVRNYDEKADYICNNNLNTSMTSTKEYKKLAKIFQKAEILAYYSHEQAEQ